MRSVYNNPKGAIINMLNNLTEHMNIKKRRKGNVELLEMEVAKIEFIE